MRGRSSAEHLGGLLAALSQEGVLGILGEPGAVGGDDDVVHPVEGVVRIRALVLQHIQAGAGDFPGLQGLDQIALLNDGAPGGIDDIGGFLHFLKCLLIKEVFGLLIQGQGNGNYVAYGAERVKVHLFHAEFTDGFGAHIGVVSDHVHLQRLSLGCDPFGDAAKTA